MAENGAISCVSIMAENDALTTFSRYLDTNSGFFGVLNRAKRTILTPLFVCLYGGKLIVRRAVCGGAWLGAAKLS